MTIEIPYIETTDPSLIPSDAVKCSIKHNNWEQDYPYSPAANALLWHNGETLFIAYEVEENHIAAMADHDNDSVYKDSCVEFFIAFDNNGYYNIEANCIGKILMSHRKGRKIDVNYASPDILSKIKRVSSLGSDPFECKEATGKWSLTLSIPKTSFFNHNIKTLRGLEAKCNIYKCGDALPRPHFLSWSPIKTEKPDFHRPDFFGSIRFV